MYLMKRDVFAYLPRVQCRNVRVRVCIGYKWPSKSAPSISLAISTSGFPTEPPRYYTDAKYVDYNNNNNNGNIFVVVVVACVCFIHLVVHVKQLVRRYQSGVCVGVCECRRARALARVFLSMRWSMKVCKTN